MNTAVIESTSTTREVPRPRTVRDAWLYLLFCGLIGIAWLISRAELFKSGDDVSYWMAVVGGSMMVVLLLYPARKYIRVMRHLGRVKWWFWMHMLCGLFGPWLILVHSTFHIGSLNAGVALFSMVTVVISGVVGRFIYVRVHRGLDGEKTSLRELQARAGMAESQARSKLAFAPDVELRLADFEKQVLGAAQGTLAALGQAASLPMRQWHARRLCHLELDAPLTHLAAREQWTAEELKRRRRLARKLVTRYLEAVTRVAQFTAYEKLFALWHVAHLPFVFLLVASAIVHVVAVHAY